jgi:DnaJ-class molecular chaperone
MSLYDKLGVSKDASKQDITKAFRKLAVEHHPDKGGNEEKFKDISHAYEILTDEDKRKRYDLTGSDSDQPQHNPFQQGGFNFHFGGGNPFDFMFNQAFGGGHHQQREEPMHKLDDTVYIIDISLKEAYFGLTKTLAVTTQKKCNCTSVCDKCKGECRIRVMRQLGPMRQIMEINCDMCQGKGYTIAVCMECKGLGQTKAKETFNIVIPKGAISGLERRMTGKGQQPFKKTEIAGDLVFKINVQEHSHFKRRNNDLIYNANISFVDSVCGVEIKVEHFDGELKLNTSTFGIVKEGVEYIIKDRGMPGGNLIIIFKVEYPETKLTEEQRNKIRDVLS